MNCASCGEDIALGQGIALAGTKNTPGVTVCANCAQALERTLVAETRDPNIIGALLFGGGAAGLTAVVWSGIVVLTNYQIGILAIAVGWVVATAVVFGAGRKRGGVVQAIAIAGTLVSMLISEYIIVRHFTVAALAEEGITGIPLLLRPSIALELIMEGVRADPMTLLFWAVALYMAFTIPRRRKLNTAAL